MKGEFVNELALFAGAGGGILGGKLMGWRTVCAVERDPYAASVLIARQNDGILPPFPIWDDVCTFDGKPWRGIVDVVSGGFPCQDISVAGSGQGIAGERSGLWSQMARIIGEVRPFHVLVENSPALTSRGLGRVLGDLASLGYDAEWGVLGAIHAGAPHKRERIWIVAHPAGLHCDTWGTEPAGQQWQAGAANGGNDMADSDSMRELQPEGCQQNKRGWVSNGSRNDVNTNSEHVHNTGLRTGETPQQQTATIPGMLFNPNSTWWATEPDVGRVANGVAARVDRLKAIGNGQVPAVVAAAWEILTT